MNVYVMQSSAGLVKVGISKNPQQRARALAHASGFHISLERTFPHAKARDIERIAHDLLKPLRQLGEWFSASVEDVAEAVSEATRLAEQGGTQRTIQPRQTANGAPASNRNAKWRKEHPEQYRQIMRDYMRKKRAKPE